jgi:hypothetical protein
VVLVILMSLLISNHVDALDTAKKRVNNAQARLEELEAELGNDVQVATATKRVRSAGKVNSVKEKTSALVENADAPVAPADGDGVAPAAPAGDTAADVGE